MRGVELTGDGGPAILEELAAADIAVEGGLPQSLFSHALQTAILQSIPVTVANPSDKSFLNSQVVGRTFSHLLVLY